MWIVGPIGFAAPWVLLGLVALPVLWLLLRAVPPAPIRRRFPGVALLLGLKDEEVETDRTPWWLLLLRMLAVAALIVAFAGPVLHPRVERAGASGPLVVLMDASWASAQDWALRIGRVEQALEEAEADDRTVCILVATSPAAEGCDFLSAADWRARLAGLEPAPYAPDMEALAARLAGIDGGFATLWISDGLAREGRDTVLSRLGDRGPVAVFENPRPLYALSDAAVTETGVDVTVLRRAGAGEATLTLAAHGPDPAGVARILARQEVVMDAGETARTVSFDLPPELRNRIDRFEIDGQRSAGAKHLADDSLRRREVGLVTVRENREGLQLLSQLHYLRAALAGKADVVEGGLTDLINANPDVIILADIAQLAEGETAPLLDWVNEGGLLLRFAGPNLAASDVARDDSDPLLPVRLRAGGRTIGGAMSWGEPKTLRAFADSSPFYGLPLPPDVTVSAQVMAQPDPDLAARVIATLADGTPLVTRNAVGQGQVVLFHVTANAEWSTLPLSGLFVSMLDRLAVTSRAEEVTAEDLTGQTLQPLRLLDGFGDLFDAGTRAPVAGEDFATARASAATPPGIYEGRDSLRALNAVAPDTELLPADWPADVPVTGVESRAERPLTPHLLLAALALLGIDLIASLALSGRLFGTRALPLVLLGFLALPGQTRAQDDYEAFALAATEEVVLAYVETGDAALDGTSEAGLRGLSAVLNARTSVEPAPPMGVDLETDPIGFFPVLYWPVTPDQPQPSAEAYARLNAYLRTGGMILFDTRDADVAGFGAATPTGAKLQALARPLDIPPLEQIPEDHVLTRAFYLLREFPGRHAEGTVWVEASPETERAEGMPFRNLNDNVTPVIIGGGDWASAWAVGEDGYPRLPVGRGFSGERQRELAYRFGVNLVMYVLTGNYKSDQVHVPALLDRLGQ
ncbi:DUF4159 domain-containing protein [Celeribacter indicus]|uniref:LytTR family transcriptional regulator n=1 Tax=Celeribacter indicus TaxID=1208324 RepID=A0A0B5DQX3_9RHOB|nr:DUF4159 domain-containing protein [Celeribacter indicus]AJE45494.1 hypothetical protein P73_0779 [Celeribacter indicus]SDW87594.1 N-terminal double-transmembrane domain-containing protein [Celeribacter indicus]